jgi:hypothetical protein
MSSLDHPPSPLRYTLGFLVMLAGVVRVVKRIDVAWEHMSANVQSPPGQTSHNEDVAELQIAPLAYFVLLRRRSPAGVKMQRHA